MFKKRTKLAGIDNSCFDTIISPKTHITGSVHFTGGLRVDGIIDGDIEGRDDSNTRVAIGENGHIRGNVTANQVIIGGTIEGSIICKGKLDLLSSAQVHGDMQYGVLCITAGANASGKWSSLPGKPGSTAAEKSSTTTFSKASKPTASARSSAQQQTSTTGMATPLSNKKPN